MCYDDIDEIGRRVEAVKAAKADRDHWFGIFDDAARRSEVYRVDVSEVELRSLIEDRLARATNRLNELVAPVKRVEPGDRAKEIEALNARKGLPSQEAST